MAAMNTLGRTVTVNGVDLYYEERGGGEPLLLLHGLTGSSGDWQHLFDLEEWSREYRLVMPDMRGHGRSNNPSGEFSFRQCAQDVYALLDHLRLERVRALGVSLGAKTLLHMATQAPARISDMILVSAAPHFPEATRGMMRAAADAMHSEEEWAFMRERHKNGDAQIRALWGLPARLADSEGDLAFSRERLSVVRARTLVVCGDRDPLYSVELSVEMWRGISGASLWVVPGGGHSPVFGDARGEFGRVARGFFAGDATG